MGREISNNQTSPDTQTAETNNLMQNWRESDLQGELGQTEMKSSRKSSVQSIYKPTLYNIDGKNKFLF